MPSRSNFTIKKLVHRPDSPYEYRPAAQQHGDETAHMDHFRQRTSSQPAWSRGRSKKLSTDPVLFSSPQSVHNISKPVPPLPEEMPRSSSFSSLSSGERHLDHYPSRRNRNTYLQANKGGNGSVSASSTRPHTPEVQQQQRKSSDSDDDIPPPPPPKSSPPAAASRPLTPLKKAEEEPVQSPTRSEGSIDSSRSFLDLGEWPEPPSQPKSDKEDDNVEENDNQQQQQQRKDSGDSQGDDWSKDIEQLIKETDKAWDDIGDAFNELGEPASLSGSPEPPAVPPKEDPRPYTPPASVASVPSTPPRSPLSRGPHQANNPTPPLKPQSSPTQDTFATKAQKPTPPKKSIKSSRAVEPLKRMPRWKLDENVKEVLTGQIFKKIEADEMLTPQRLREVQAIREQEEQRERRSSESDRLPPPMPENEGNETPIDAFHLQDLPSRIGAAGVRSTSQQLQQQMGQQPQQQNDTAAAARSDQADHPVRRDSSIPRKPVTSEQETPDIKITNPSQSSTTTPAPASTQALPPLTLPPRSSSKAAQQMLQSQPPLETIPEVQSIVSPLKTPMHEFTTQLFQPNNDDDDDFVFYYSSPFTLNMPSFRHGPIRFPKSDIARCMNMNLNLAPDDTLDWTAFQMAIIGGAGDFFSDPSDFGASAGFGISSPSSARPESDDLDDLADWFDGFGFQHRGELVTERMAEADAAWADAAELKGRSGSEQPSLSYSASTPDDEFRPRSSGAASRSSAEYSPAVTDPDTLPIPVAHEHPAGFWHDNDVGAKDGFMRADDGNRKVQRWTLENPSKKHQRGQDSVASLPQSPMMDLVFVRSSSTSREPGTDGVGAGTGGPDDDDADGDFVPMGYNLGHDLGDFLRWEAQHVSALGQD